MKIPYFGCSLVLNNNNNSIPFQFLSSMNLMDYSVCLGVHDVERGEQEALEKEKEQTSDLEGSGGDVGSDEDEDSGGSGAGGGNAPTPPDSPQAVREEGAAPFDREGGLDPARDIYATASAEGEWVFLFMVGF